MPSHDDCDKGPLLISQGQAIEAITSAMNNTVEQLKNVARLLEQNAEARTGLRHVEKEIGEFRRYVEKEQEAQWRRIDEGLSLSHRAIDASTAASTIASQAATAAAQALTKAVEAKKKADDLGHTPGRIALKAIGTVCLMILAALIGAHFKGG